jgi:hypothetical protein
MVRRCDLPAGVRLRQHAVLKRQQADSRRLTAERLHRTVVMLVHYTYWSWIRGYSSLRATTPAGSAF